MLQIPVKEGESIEFNVSNSTACSSVLNFDVHSRDYPGVKFINSINKLYNRNCN